MLDLLGLMAIGATAGLIAKALPGPMLVRSLGACAGAWIGVMAYLLYRAVQEVSAVASGSGGIAAVSTGLDDSFIIDGVVALATATCVHFALGFRAKPQSARVAYRPLLIGVVSALACGGPSLLFGA